MSYDRTKLKQDLIRDECIGGKPSLESYQDSVGLWTIGVGHMLGTERRMLKINNVEAMALLDSDIVTAEHVLDGWIPLWANLDEVRQRALLNMCFNLGNRVLQFVNTREGIIRQDWMFVSTNMLKSKWAQQVGARADRLSRMMALGKDA
jgi:lysozyme